MVWIQLKQILEIAPAPLLSSDPSAEATYRDRERPRIARTLKTAALSFFALGLVASLPELLAVPVPGGADGLIAWVPLGQALAALGGYLLLLHPFVARRPLLAGLFMGVCSGLSLGVLLALRAGVDTPLRGVTRLATVALLVLMLSLPWWILIRALLPVGQLEERVRAQIRELRLLAAHLERAREEERSRIARELHDELGQELTAMRYTLGFLKQRFERDPGSIRGNIDELESLLARTATTTRHLLSELRPRALDELGLDAGVAWLLEQTREKTGLRCELAASGSMQGLDADVATAAYRILQESLTNVARHAGASRVDVELTLRDEELELVVRDDGIGVEGAKGAAAGAGERRGMGLVGMRERADALGGELRIESRHGEGTTIRVRLPAPRRRAAEEVPP
jgi:signal transduction histidine kinase